MLTGVLGGRLSSIMRPTTLVLAIAVMLSATIAKAQDRNASLVHVFPVIVNGTQPDGTTYRTSLIMQNGGVGSSSCWIELVGAAPAFTAPDGTTAVGGLIQQILPSNSFDVLRTSGAGGLTSGYAVVSCSSPIVAYTVYSTYETSPDGSRLTSETAVNSSASATALQFINDAREDGRLALAITNDQFVPSLVRLQVFDLYGRLLAATQFTIPARTSYSRFLNELVRGLPARHIGPVRLDSSQLIYAIGLKFTGGVVSSVPASLSGFIR